MEKVMERFVDMLEDGQDLKDFASYCRKLHVIPGDLDDYLLRETGFSGQEIVDSWTKGICIGELI